MGSDRERLTAMIGTGLARGMDIVAAFKAARAGEHLLSPEARELDRAHRAALAAHERTVAASESRLRRARRRMTSMTATAGVTGTLAVLSGVTSVGLQPITVLFAAVTGVAGLAAYRAREVLAQPAAAPRYEVPPPPPPVLRAGALGATETADLLRIRTQLASITPAVRAVHPAAGAELARADAEAGPALNALVQRLAILDSIACELPGTEAAEAAQDAARDVQGRLATGVRTYDRLIAASATMLAAPDLHRSSDEVLAPAIQGLAAYAHGLAVTARAFES